MKERKRFENFIIAFLIHRVIFKIFIDNLKYKMIFFLYKF